MSRPVILLTGFWPPTNEILETFSETNCVQKNIRWMGKNWKNLGFDLHAYFPVFKNFSEEERPKGEGVMQVDYDSVKKDLPLLYEKHQPVMILSFGKSQGAPWEIEMNFPDYWNTGLPTGHSTLPAYTLKNSLEKSGRFPKDFIFIDEKGDAGNFVCGFTGLQLCQLQLKHSELKYIGFIHVNTSLELAKEALELTLISLIESFQHKQP